MTDIKYGQQVFKLTDQNYIKLWILTLKNEIKSWKLSFSTRN